MSERAWIVFARNLAAKVPGAMGTAHPKCDKALHSLASCVMRYEAEVAALRADQEAQAETLREALSGFVFHKELPTAWRVAEFTPEGHATPLFGIVAEYGWAERILFSNAYEKDALAIADLIRTVLATTMDAPSGTMSALRRQWAAVREAEAASAPRCWMCVEEGCDTVLGKRDAYLCERHKPRWPTHDCKPHGRPPLPGPENPVGVCDLCGYDEGER